MPVLVVFCYLSISGAIWRITKKIISVNLRNILWLVVVVSFLIDIAWLCKYINLIALKKKGHYLTMMEIVWWLGRATQYFLIVWSDTTDIVLTFRLKISKLIFFEEDEHFGKLILISHRVVNTISLRYGIALILILIFKLQSFKAGKILLTLLQAAEWRVNAGWVNRVT